MADFRLSSQADTDLAGIADYTLETFGIEKPAAIGMDWMLTSRFLLTIHYWAKAPTTLHHNSGVLSINPTSSFTCRRITAR